MELVELIKRCEGFAKVVRWQPVPTAAPYLCPAGHWTRGYGVLCRPDAGEITEPEAAAELVRILPAYRGHALRLSPGLQGSQLDAVTDWIYNLGPVRYASSTFRRRVNARLWREAAEECRKWVWGGGRRLPGLVVRRELEAQLLLV